MINRILCVAEKPSISKSVAQILSGGALETRSTKNKYIKNYEFTCKYQGRDCHMVMTALLGHLMETEFDPPFKYWSNTTTPQLFHANIKKAVKNDMKDLETNLRAEARMAQMLVIWTDCDLEGENIGAEVAEICRSVNPRIIIKRAKFSVIQPREIKVAWGSLIDLDMNAAYAVDARSELDLRIGAVFSRFQTLLLKNRFEGLKEQRVLSYGSCQFPTLGFVVDRYLRAENFVEEPFWGIKAAFQWDGIPVNFTWGRGVLFDHQCTLIIYESCVEAPTGTITKVLAKPTSKWAPLPLTTIEMQKALSSYMKISSDRVMIIAEKLYNEGIISYPRTETDSFAETFELKPLIEKQIQDLNWGRYAQSYVLIKSRLLDGKFRIPRKGTHNDEAHPPIHPVRAAHNLAGEEQKVFEFITRRFLACCSAAASGQSTQIELKIAGEFFKASGLMVLERNYLDVYTYDKWSNHSVPVLHVGMQAQPTILEMSQSHTSKPAMLSESDLLTLMDQSGIGTDATIHEHIKKIIDRNYATKENGFFYPTTLGMALVTGYDDMNIELSLSKPDLRREMEMNMRKICEGVMTKQHVVDSTVAMYLKAFESAKGQSQTLIDSMSKYMNDEPIPVEVNENGRDSTEEIVRNCIKCGMPQVLRRLPNLKYIIGCVGFPTCKEALFLPDFIALAKKSDCKCERCSINNGNVFQLDISFRPGSVPIHYESPMQTCVWCNDDLKELFFQSRPGPGPGPGNGNVANTGGIVAAGNGINIGRGHSHSNNGVQLGGMVTGRNDHPIQQNFNRNDPTTYVCLCEMPSLTLIAKKDGPNKGRGFHACSKQQNDETRCSFFQWDVDNSNPNQFSSSSTQRFDTNTNSLSFNNSASIHVVCLCGIPACERVVRKEGDNQGKAFLACSKSQDDGTKCAFFSWKDNLNESRQSQGRTQQSVVDGYIENMREDVNLAKIKCKCSLVAVKKVSGMNTGNPGREFLACPKTAVRCDFFEWIPEGDTRATGRFLAGNSTGGAFGTGAEGTCYTCKRVGHFAADCSRSNANQQSLRGRGRAAVVRGGRGMSRGRRGN